MLTAATEAALRRSAADLAAYVENHPEAAPGAVCYSTRTARTPGAWRVALAGHEDIAARLRAVAGDEGSPRAHVGRAPSGAPRIAFRFAGFDAQAFEQAGQLLREAPAFREAMKGIAPEPDLVAALAEAGDGPVPPATAFPAWVAGQAALAQMLHAWGIRPASVAGEGPGALAALAVAGALTTDEALAAAAAWGRLLEAGEKPDGADLPERLGLPTLQTPTIPILNKGALAGRDLTEMLDAFDAVVVLGAGPDKSTNGRPRRPVLLPLLAPGTPALETLYAAVGRLWVGGAPVDPFALGAGPGRSRVGVPTYPFERTPYRVPPPAPPPPVATAGPAPASRETDVLGWMHEVAWEASPLPRPGSTSLARWVVVPAAVPAARRLAAHLHEELEFHGYACEQASPDGLPAALAGGPCGVVFVGPVGPPPPLDTLDALMRGQEQGALAFHAVGRALLAAPAARRPRGVWVLTEGAFPVDGGDAHRAPDRAMLAGLALALPDEIAGLDCRVVDLDPAVGTGQQLGTVLEELEAEAGSGLVAWRGGRRWSRHLRAHPTPHRPKPPAYRGDGVYLITGGATGLGAEVARSLAAHGATALVLVGRTPAGRDPRRTALVRDLRRAGADAEYRAADITRPEAVTALVGDLVKRHGRIAGVVHAAGIARAGSIGKKTRAQVAAVLAPKVRGTWLLARALRHAGQQVDFFACFSSISAVAPGLGGGLSDYVAANAFLDAFAHAERAQGRPVTSINWSIWSEAGLGANPLILKNLAARGIHGISTEDGVRAFHHALVYGTGQVVVLNHAPQADSDPATSFNGESRTGTRPATPRSAPARPMSTRAVAPAHEETPHGTPSSADIERLIQSLLAEKLDTPPDEVAVEVPFVALGLDSLDALDLVADLEKTRGWSLPETLFFEYQTIRELARFLSTYPAPGTPERLPTPAATAGPSTL
jgi:NADP-dependent 3-hydroxy acid dehydrogenase YdfG/acyl carrier protein